MISVKIIEVVKKLQVIERFFEYFVKWNVLLIFL